VSLLAEREVAALTMDEIAARAGSSKATIYRRWSSKEELLAEALGRATGAFPPPDTGTLRGDLVEALGHLLSILTESPLGSAMPALIAAGVSSPELHGFIVRTVGEPRRALIRTILRRGIARGELDPATDLDLFMDLIGGPIHFRCLVTHEPVDAAYGEQLVDAALRAFAPRER
jgi:AcrR family transcriptional regulator